MGDVAETVIESEEKEALVAGLQPLSEEQYSIWSGTGTWTSSHLKGSGSRKFVEPESYEEFLTRGVIPRIGSDAGFQLSEPMLQRLNTSRVVDQRSLPTPGASTLGSLAEEEEPSPDAGVGGLHLASQHKSFAATADAGSSFSLSGFAGASSSSLMDAEEQAAEAKTFWAGVEAAKGNGKAPAYRPAPVYATAPGAAPAAVSAAAAGAVETAAAYCSDSTASAASSSSAWLHVEGFSVPRRQSTTACESRFERFSRPLS